MSYLIDNIPYFYCMVRREYTQNLKEGHGEHLKALAIAAWCRRGRMLGFQVIFLGKDHEDKPNNTGGAMFSQVPIEALVWKDCNFQEPKYIQPWDVFSENFAVVTFELLKDSICYVLPARMPGRYMFTIDFTRSDLADDPDQHKQLHVIKMDAGHFGAFPNNRLIFQDPPFWKIGEETPRFQALAPEFRSE